MSIAAAVRPLFYSKEISTRKRLYSMHANSRAEQLTYQLQLWNVQWQQISQRNPYWDRLRRERTLPGKFESWEQFCELMPIMTRTHLKRSCEAMVARDSKPDFYRTTGGTTAEPVQLPASKTERKITRADTWMARAWYGIGPSSRLFLIWGHSHLFGSGVKGWINGRIRSTCDRLLGYKRFSAYDLGYRALQRAGQAILKFRPDYLLGYSVALDLFARANGHLRERLRTLRIKMIVGTAEGFPAPDSIALLEDLFGCPVAMEYGTVETDLIAHTHPEGGYRTFWQTYFVEGEKANTASNVKIRVTSLYPRCLPLVRYELGDEIEPDEQDNSQLLLGIRSFKRVCGRCNDWVSLSDGTRVHSEVFSHLLRGHKEVDGYQVVQTGEDIRLLTLVRGPLDPVLAERLRITLGKVHPLLAQVSIEQVPALTQTRAGKTPMIIRLDDQVTA